MNRRSFLVAGAALAVVPAAPAAEASVNRAVIRFVPDAPFGVTPLSPNAQHLLKWMRHLNAQTLSFTANDPKVSYDEVEELRRRGLIDVSDGLIPEARCVSYTLTPEGQDLSVRLFDATTDFSPFEPLRLTSTTVDKVTLSAGITA